jgi:hypothetical protein
MPLLPGDKLCPYEILSPIDAGGIQPSTRTIGVMVGSMTRQKGGVAAGAKAHSEIRIMHTIGAHAIPSLSFSNCWVTVSSPGLSATSTLALEWSRQVETAGNGVLGDTFRSARANVGLR